MPFDEIDFVPKIQTKHYKHAHRQKNFYVVSQTKRVPPRETFTVGQCIVRSCSVVINFWVASLIMQDKELAKMLLRPNGLFIEDLGQESILTEARYGSVSRVFVVCEEDGVMGEEFQHWLIQNSPPKEVKSMPKAGHMVMLSKPKDLAFCLQNIVDEYH